MPYTQSDIDALAASVSIPPVSIGDHLQKQALDNPAVLECVAAMVELLEKRPAALPHLQAFLLLLLVDG